jgi:tRNA-uridine 2-sulfurtransferase
MKVLVAMSGGVDSSVAAAMLVEQGYDVTGVHLRLADIHGADDGGRVHGCCGVTDADDARRVAQVLDIPFYVWNMKDEFAAGIVDDFVAEYARGRTPNPCVRCNERVKFGALLERALQTDFDAVATGHYARRTFDGDRYRLHRSVDETKDQSYVLARLGQRELAHALFPVGAQSKATTREIARSLELRTANKPESYDICFVPDGDAAGFVERALESPAVGEVVSSDGEVLGTHGGVHRFTIGQRRGLGVETGAARTYVLEVDAPTQRVVVGPAEMLSRAGLEADELRWTDGDPPARIDHVQVRAHGGVFAATLADVAPHRVAVRFEEPQRGIAPGQLVAFYLGDEVVGGGTIARSLSAADLAG